MAPSLPLTGGCQCRRHTYRVTAPPLTLYACHCHDCQVQSARSRRPGPGGQVQAGGAFGMSMPVRRGAFTVDGPDALGRQVRGSASGREVGLRFCRDCGVRLFHEPARDPTLVNVKPGTLDDTGWLYPVAHLWLASAQPWIGVPAEVLGFAGQPADFAPLRQAFAARFGDGSPPG